ncbi:hypothetical protein RSAG8_09635, partial [Rhizoctonia solani AG-8 WAC10335]
MPSRPKSKPEPDLYQVPPRPATPSGLRDALSAIPSLICDAAGYVPETLDQCHFPRAPVTPLELEQLPSPEPEPTPEPAPALPKLVKYKPFSKPYPSRDDAFICNTYMPEDLVYCAVIGRYQRAPWEPYTFSDAAYDLYSLEFEHRHFFEFLTEMFSLSNNYSSVPLCPRYAEIMLDLVRGWSIVPCAWENGWPAPDPHPWCPCCPRQR